jgi:hypothetical protein
MRFTSGSGSLLGVLILAIVRPALAEITDEQVRTAIDRGVEFLRSQQRADGSWRENTQYPGGISALCVLSLLSAGVEPADPKMQLALSYLRGLPAPTMVYTGALQTMVFCAAEPNKDAALIRRNVEWLQSVQLTEGTRRGAWGYSGGRGNGDNSNSQFAVLALHEAERAGIAIRPEVWRNAWDYWVQDQKPDGSWGYFAGEPSTGSMTSAGIASLIMCAGRVSAGDAQVVNGAVQCCSEQADNEAVERGLQWLGSKFSAARNPSPINLPSSYYYYYLYGIERVGRMSGRRFLGRHDWYRAGAEVLVSQQDSLRGLWVGNAAAEANPLISTSFALLFLAKGRRPVVLARLQYGEGREWNLHREAVGNLTRRVESRWQRDLTWQTIDVRAATVENLLEAPVLFISGRNGLDLSTEQRENLRGYVNQGGFLFVEACCEGGDFDRDFRSLAKQIFPDSPLRLLPPDHPVWWAEERVDAKFMRPLYGIDACCRTSVVYCPQNLSCYWELSSGTRPAEYPAPIAAEIEACLRTGVNVVTYATNRELKNKLDRPRLMPERTAGEQASRGVLQLPKLLHSGGGDDAPNALPNLLAILGAQGALRVDAQNRLVSAEDPGLYEYPLLFLHGRRGFRFSAPQRKALAAYVERGGVIFADSICASVEFTSAFRREFEAIFPDRKLTRIAPEHPLFTRQARGFDLKSVTLRDPQLRSGDDPLKADLVQTTPLLEGLEIDGRLAVIFSPYDISCALESGASLQCKGYIKEDAAKIGINIILYALQE